MARVTLVWTQYYVWYSRERSETRHRVRENRVGTANLLPFGVGLGVAPDMVIMESRRRGSFYAHTYRG